MTAVELAKRLASIDKELAGQRAVSRQQANTIASLKRENGQLQDELKALRSFVNQLDAKVRLKLK